MSGSLRLANVFRAMSTTYSQPAIPKSPASTFHDAIHILNPIKASTFAILCLQSRAILPKKKGPGVVTKILYFFLGFLWVVDVALIINFIYTGVEHREFAFMVRITKLSTNCGGPSQVTYAKNNTKLCVR